MKVTRKNPFTGEELTLDLPITEGQYLSWQKGMVAQRAFPSLTADQREFIISGIPPGEFERTLACPVARISFSESLERVNILISEASTVGFPVGEWPDLIKFDDADQEVFKRAELIDNGDELGGYTYREINGSMELRIYND